MPSTKQKFCSNCGATFGCGLESEEKCWCEDLPHVPMTANKDQDCLCPKCLWAMVQEKTRDAQSQSEDVVSEQNSEAF